MGAFVVRDPRLIVANRADLFFGVDLLGTHPRIDEFVSDADPPAQPPAPPTPKRTSLADLREAARRRR